MNSNQDQQNEGGLLGEIEDLRKRLRELKNKNERVQNDFNQLNKTVTNLLHEQKDF